MSEFLASFEKLKYLTALGPCSTGNNQSELSGNDSFKWAVHSRNFNRAF